MHAARALVAGNWKMHKTVAEATAFVRELLALEPDLEGVDAVICSAVHGAVRGRRRARAAAALGLGAQTMWDCDSGAFTGEISPLMLLDCGARWVILGHSERRAYSGETDAAVNRKVRCALARGHHADRRGRRDGARITPPAARTSTSSRKPRPRSTGSRRDDVARCVVAYEPIWAIGTGLADTPAGANDVMAQIRGAVAGLERTRILYGGSVKPDNIGAFVAQPHIDGALVGGASLERASFADLIANARAVTVR